MSLDSIRESLARGVTSTGRWLSPRRRRWLEFLHSLPLDPETLTAPLAAPGERDFVICGCSRTGTTLLAAALYQPPSVITVMEPWDGMRMEPAPLFGSLRAEISAGKLSRGRLDVDALLNEGSVSWSKEGSAAHPIKVDEGYSLGVKWPGYWRFLNLLPDTKFLVCVRHPVEVISSFKKIGGRLAQGLNYDTRFNRSMNDYLIAATTNPELRRILLFEYVHQRLVGHLSSRNVYVVRYERWFQDRARMLDEIGTFLGTEVGPGAPTIRAPGHASLSESEMELLLRHCETAASLGYELERDAA
jgi:hypothetical protein